MAEGGDVYDTWHGLTLTECIWCGAYYHAESCKDICPECGARKPDIVEWPV